MLRQLLRKALAFANLTGQLTDDSQLQLSPKGYAELDKGAIRDLQMPSAMYTLIPTVHRALLKSAVSGIGDRIHTTKKMPSANNACTCSRVC